MRLTTTADETSTRTSLGPAGWFKRLGNLIKIAGKDRAEERERALASVAGPSVTDRQAQLIQFYGQYEELVETLCDAAQYGPTPKLESNYARQRAWMREHYAPVRRYIVAYLQFSVEDARTSLDFEGEGADAFEALVAAPTLEAFLKVDDGCMISRITRTRNALTLYAEHLRQLNVSL